MSKSPKRKNVRQSDFRIVARGARRVNPDFSRLMQATLDHYMTTTESATTTDGSRPSRREADDDRA